MEYNTIVLRAEGEPPAWVVGDQSDKFFWWYKNELGEAWAARVEGNSLVVAGQDIDWTEIRLDVPTAERELAVAKNYVAWRLAKPDDSYIPFSMCRTAILNLEEVVWYLSVLMAALGPMKHSIGESQ